MTTRVSLLYGPYDGQRADLRSTPSSISIGPASGAKAVYERLDDPETGEFLGGYVWRGGHTEVWDNSWLDGYQVGRTV